jgi:4a-hydroxytetrahydrobiopterin dehydratase
MPTPPPLGEAEIAAALEQAPHWRRADDGALELRRRFAGSAAAVGFVAAVAALAERHGHHPELRWTYRDVALRLVTHDAGDAVTDLDVALMAAISTLP